MKDDKELRKIAEQIAKEIEKEHNTDYKHLYTIEHRRRVAAEARGIKAEELLKYCADCGKSISNCLKDCQPYIDWQQSIIDYNTIIKEAGE